MNIVNKPGNLLQGTLIKSIFLFYSRQGCMKNFLKTFSHPALVIYDP